MLTVGCRLQVVTLVTCISVAAYSVLLVLILRLK